MKVLIYSTWYMYMCYILRHAINYILSTVHCHTSWQIFFLSLITIIYHYTVHICS